MTRGERNVRMFGKSPMRMMAVETSKSVCRKKYVWQTWWKKKLLIC